MRCEDKRQGKGWKAGLGLGRGQRRSTEGPRPILRTLMPSGEMWRAEVRAAGLESPRQTPDATVSSVFRCPYGTASRAVSASHRSVERWPCCLSSATQRPPCKSSCHDRHCQRTMITTQLRIRHCKLDNCHGLLRA